ncbi:MAG TPA: hypothetical protein VG754_11975 [Verrucomicrobiae bacterium]|nr:hypothetical protein [Verrucomicrobiae bacterium]
MPETSERSRALPGARVGDPQQCGKDSAHELVWHVLFVARCCGSSSRAPFACQRVRYEFRACLVVETPGFLI